ncbi:MAG: DNA repair protein RecO [Caldisericaceae bacterium]
MSYIRVSGITINSIDSKDFDKYVVLLTDKFGKITAKFKSVRKTTSKRIGLTEEFALEDLLLYKKGNYYIVTEAVLKKDYANSKANFSKVIILLYMKKLILDAFPYEQEDVNLYNFVIDFLEDLEESNEALNYEYLAFFILKFLKFMGFSIDLKGNIDDIKFFSIDNDGFNTISGIPVRREVIDEFLTLSTLKDTEEIKKCYHIKEILDLVLEYARVKLELNEFDSFKNNISKIV